MSVKNDLCSLVEVYALGGLEEEELLLFEDHLEKCPNCQLELRELGPVVDHLLDSLPQYKIPKDLKKKVFDHIRKNTDFFDKDTKKSTRLYSCYIAGFIAASIFLISAYTSYAHFVTKREIVELQKDNRNLKRKIVEIEHRQNNFEHKHKSLNNEIADLDRQNSKEKNVPQEKNKKQNLVDKNSIAPSRKREENTIKKGNSSHKEKDNDVTNLPKVINPNKPNNRSSDHHQDNLPDQPIIDQPIQEPGNIPSLPDSDKDKDNNNNKKDYDTYNDKIYVLVPDLPDISIGSNSEGLQITITAAAIRQDAEITISVERTRKIRETVPKKRKSKKVIIRGQNR
jgi:hypothetical protein